MYSGFVVETEDEYKELTELSKAYAREAYKGGKTWVKIAVCFKRLSEHADRFVDAQEKRAFAGQEELTAMWPAADLVAKAVADHADDLAEAAKQYHEAHKDPTSWLAKNKKKEKSRADLAKKIMAAAKELTKACKRVKPGKFTGPDLSRATAWVEAREGFAELAEAKAVVFERYLKAAQALLKRGAEGAEEARTLVDRVDRELGVFNKDPVFIASRASAPPWPKGVRPETTKPMLKRGAVAFETGMRASATMLACLNEIREIAEDLTDLEEEGDRQRMDGVACLKQLALWRADALKLGNKTGKMQLEADKKTLAKYGKEWDDHPDPKAREGVAVSYLAKRNEVRERVVAARSVGTQLQKLKKRVDQLPEPTDEVAQAKAEIGKLIVGSFALPKEYYSRRQELLLLVEELDSKIDA